jgi:hypothetical protein
VYVCRALDMTRGAHPEFKFEVPTPKVAWAYTTLDLPRAQLRYGEVQVAFKNPVRTYLSAATLQSPLVCRVMERTAPLTDIMALLEDHGLAAAFNRSCAVIPKRPDGSTIFAKLLLPQHSIAEAQDAIECALVRPPTRHKGDAMHACEKRAPR